MKLLQHLKNHKENKIQLREEKIRQYEEQKEKKKEEERLQQQKLEEERQKQVEEENANKQTVETDDDKDEEEEERNDVNANEDKELERKTDNSEVCVSQLNAEVTSTEETPLQVHSLSAKSDLSAPFVISTAVNYFNTNTQTLYSSVNSQPSAYTPVLVPTQCSSQTSSQKSPTKSGSNINFADFEGDTNDPFDSVALKSINDMEELAKILQASNIKQQRIDPNSSNMSYTYQQQNNYMNGGYQYNPYMYANYTQPNLPMNTSIYNHLSPSTTASVPLIGKNNTVFQQDGYSHATFSQWNHIPPAHSKQTQESQNYNFGIPQSGLPLSNVPLDNTSSSNVVPRYPIIPVSTQAGVTSLSSGATQGLDTGIESMNKRQDLEDFYTRYYSNKKSPISKARSGASTPTSCQQNQQTSKGSLSSSSSVPDLTAVEDSEVVCNNFEKFTSRESLSNAFMRQRSSSTEGYEVS